MAATNASAFDLTTEAGVEGYVDNTPYACTRAEALSGGLGNYAFRLHLRQPYEGHETVILKHSRPYVKALTHIPLDIGRQVKSYNIQSFLPADEDHSISRSRL